MGKKKREHVVFDKMATNRKIIPFAMVNKKCKKSPTTGSSKGNEKS